MLLAAHWCYFLLLSVISKQIVRSKFEKMPADNDRVESRAQISTPSASTPSTAQAQAIPQAYRQLIASNFLLPSSMKCQGDVAGNWEFFKQQWSDYESATGLDKREELVCLVTLRSAMGRECLQILLNLNLSEEDKKIDNVSKLWKNISSRPEMSCTSGMFLTLVHRQAKNPFKRTSQDWGN